MRIRSPTLAAGKIGIPTVASGLPVIRQGKQWVRPARYDNQSGGASDFATVIRRGALSDDRAD